MKWLSGVCAVVVLAGAASASAADYLVLPAAWSDGAELNAPSATETTTPKTPEPGPLPMPADPPPTPAPEAQPYEGPLTQPNVGYFTWFGQGCCERQPSCCDNVWDGFCGQRKHWCHKCPKCVTCDSGCGHKKHCGHGWTGQHMACRWFAGNPGCSLPKWNPWHGCCKLFGGHGCSPAGSNCTDCASGAPNASYHYDLNEPQAPTPAVPSEAPATTIQGTPAPVPTPNDRTALRPSLIPAGLRLFPWASGQ